MPLKGKGNVTAGDVTIAEKFLSKVQNFVSSQQDDTDITHTLAITSLKIGTAYLSLPIFTTVIGAASGPALAAIGGGAAGTSVLPNALGALAAAALPTVLFMNQQTDNKPAQKGGGATSTTDKFHNDIIDPLYPNPEQEAAKRVVLKENPVYNKLPADLQQRLLGRDLNRVIPREDGSLWVKRQSAIHPTPRNWSDQQIGFRTDPIHNGRYHLTTHSSSNYLPKDTHIHQVVRTIEECLGLID
jgi:hypothetical protein